MQRATDLITEADHQRVTEAVKAAESKTSAEIVPVVATDSGRYDRSEDIVGLWLGMIALALTWFLLPDFRAEPGSWGGVPIILELLLYIIAVVVGFVIGAILGSKIGWLRRLFTAQQQMRDEVEARARQVFFDSRVHHTEGATGLLLYVSLFEHMAVVLADQSVTEKLGQPTLDELCSKFTQLLHTGSIVDAMCQVIEEAGDRMQPVLPRSEDDKAELPDALITID